MGTLLQDVRYAMRQLRRAPGFTVAAVLTLALGIGANAAIFSAVYTLLVRSLPFQGADRIVSIFETHPQIVGGSEVTFADYRDWKVQQKSFEQIAAYSAVSPGTASMVVDGRAAQVQQVLASGNFFSLLGANAELGRTLVEQDDTAGNNHVAVLSSEAWQRYFDRDPAVLGRTVDLNGAAYTVIGVLAQGSTLPANGEVWLPLSLLGRKNRSLEGGISSTCWGGFGRVCRSRRRRRICARWLEGWRFNTRPRMVLSEWCCILCVINL